MQHHVITLPYRNEMSFKVDAPVTDAIQTLLDAAEPTKNAAHFDFIMSLWLPSIQESFIDGNAAVAYAKMHAFYLLARNHRHLRPNLVEAAVDQCRSMDHVLTFIISHPAGAEQLTAEAEHLEASNYINTLIMLATAPDQFTEADVCILFKRLHPDVISMQEAA